MTTGLEAFTDSLTRARNQRLKYSLPVLIERHEALSHKAESHAFAVDGGETGEA